MVVCTVGNPRSVLLQLQRGCQHPFDWSVAGTAGTPWKIEVSRRAAPGARSIDDYLTWDHRRLEGMFGDVRRLLASSSSQDAGRRFADFALGLARHVAMEERILFREFERMTGAASGPTAVMRQEHARIRGMVDDVTRLLDAGDVAGATLSMDALETLLGEHEMKEEQILYPMTDRAAGDDRRRILEDMQLL